MSVETLVVGQLSTNCYLFYGEDSRHCFIIDPGDDGDYIIRKIKDLDLKPQAILTTHGHFDHVLAVTELKLAFNIPFYLHKADLAILKRTQSTAKYFTGIEPDPPAKVDKYLKHGQVLKLDKFDRCSDLTLEGKSNKLSSKAVESLKVLETPGHTPGSLSYLARDRVSNKIIFVGDLIFAGGGYGRTDLKGGDFNALQKSIKKILSLPPETIIYPGHGKSTIVKEEKKFHSIFKG